METAFNHAVGSFVGSIYGVGDPIILRKNGVTEMAHLQSIRSKIEKRMLFY